MRNFDDVPNDDDTTMKLSVTANLEPYEVLYQAWSWDGIDGESIIFHSDDIAALSDDALCALVSESPLVDRTISMTVKRTEKFTFVNFNFRS